MDSEEENRAGQLMEQLGYRKSKIVVAALNEYLENHPDLLTGEHRIQFHLKAVPQEQLEACVRRIVAEHLASGAVVEKTVDPVHTESSAVSADILEMLSDLDYFN